jgi:hypothetical protein
MPAVTLGTVTLAANANAGFSTGKWVEGSGQAFAPSYAKADIGAAGVDGVAEKRFGFRSRRFIVPAIYSASSEATAIANSMSDMASIANTSFTSTIAGVSCPACELVTDASYVELTAKPAGSYFYARAVFVVEQKRLT